MSDKFITSGAWKRARKEFLATVPHYCSECGRGPLVGRSLQVDHVLPRSTHPDLALSFSNMRVLCGPPAGNCNQVKGSKSLYRTNWFNSSWLNPAKMNGTRFTPTM